MFPVHFFRFNLNSFTNKQIKNSTHFHTTEKIKKKFKLKNVVRNKT